MKYLKILVSILFLFSLTLSAQQKKYVSYTVEKGETMKSIAKKYDISTKDLMRLNPGISRKPDPNTVIIVPNTLHETKIETISENKQLYKVLPKETLFGISRKFGITIEELIAANPELENGLKIGMELIVPKQSVTQLKDSVNFVIHEVVKDDTMFNLTRRFNVSESDLLLLNPHLKEGLKLGMLLKIKPVKAEIIETEEVEAVFKENLDLHKQIKVVLMLPYQLNKLPDSLIDKGFEKTNTLLNYTTDFHMGAVMAIDSLRKKGLNIKVDFYDTENSTYKLQNIVNKANLNDADIIIGPLYFDNAVWLSKHIKTTVVVPFYSKKQEQISTSNLIKTTPDEVELEKKLLAYLEAVYDNENIVIINDGKPDSQSDLWKTVNKLKSFNSVKEIAVIKPEKGYISSSRITAKLKGNTHNWVILISDDNETTASAINSLKLFNEEEYAITFFAFNKGKNFDKIDNNILGKLNFTFPTAEFIDFNSNEPNFFFNSYKMKNYAFPTEYSIKGFDVTYDAIARIATKGNLELGLKAGKSKRIASLFNYQDKFENEGVYLVQYTKELMPILLKVPDTE